MNKRKQVIFYIVCMILSILMAIIDSIVSAKNDVQFDITLFLKISVFFFLFGFVGHLIRFASNSYSNGLVDNKKEGMNISIFKMVCIFIIIWTPYLVIFSPGIIHWDTMIEIIDFFDGYSTVFYTEGAINVTAFLNDHHPVFDTLIFGLFIMIGNLFKNPNIGILIYSFFQMFIFATAISLLINHLKKVDASKKMINGLMFFYAFMPIFGMYSITMVKDMLFTIVFIIYFIDYIEIIQKRETNKHIIILILFSILLSLTKKTGVYLVVLSNIALLFIKSEKKEKIKLLYAIFIPILLMFILLPKVIYPAFKIYPGGKQEMLSPLFMQTANVVVEHEDKLTKDEKEVINRMLDYGKIVNAYWMYDGTYAQDVKALMRQDYSKTDLQNYIKLWIQQAFQYPWTYFKATMRMTGGFFSYSASGKLDVYYSTRTMLEDSYSTISEWKPTVNIRQYIQEFFDWIEDLPLISIFFRLATYVIVLPLISLIYIIKTGKRREMVMLVPIMVSILFLLLCPITKTRYALPIIVITPFLLLYCYCLKKHNSVNRIN